MDNTDHLEQQTGLDTVRKLKPKNFHSAGTDESTENSCCSLW